MIVSNSGASARKSWLCSVPSSQCYFFSQRSSFWLNQMQNMKSDRGDSQVSYFTIQEFTNPTETVNYHDFPVYLKTRIEYLAGL